MNRLKEIKHRRYEIIMELKQLKKELLKLKHEEQSIIGFDRLEEQKKRVKRK